MPHPQTVQQTGFRFLRSPEALDDFIREWETGQLPKHEWTHVAHIAVAAYYAVRYPDAVFEKTRDGILCYNAAVGTANTEHSGYHETLTRLWVMVVSKVVRRLDDPYAATCFAIESLHAVRNLPKLYYSFDIIHSVEARRRWVPPDLVGPY